ncbi:hypothetical protein DITRI_Ditri19aG0046700 [Diplodiscus trichospermus]
MAALSLRENDKKENVPPFSSKKPASVLRKSSSSANHNGRIRKPLEDITNLVLPQIYSTLAQSNATLLVSSQALTYQPKCRKRRAEDGLESICKKTQLVYRISRSECRLVKPKIEGENPTRPFRLLALATSSGKVYHFDIDTTRDEYTNKNLYDSKRVSPGGPDPKHH